MPDEPITPAQRGTAPASRGITQQSVEQWERYSQNRGTGITTQPNSPAATAQDPYAAHAGPLAKMSQALNRASQVKASKVAEARLDKLEEDFEKRKQALPGIGAATMARRLHQLHQDAATEGRDGLGFGVQWAAKQIATFNKKHPKDKKAQQKYATELANDLKARKLDMVSCLTMMDFPLREYVEVQQFIADEKQTPGKETRRDKLAKIFSVATDARGTGKQEVFGGRGTVVLEKLRTEFGFKTVHIDGVRDKKYWNFPNYTSDAGTRKSGFVPNKPAVVQGADSKQPIDVRVKVDQFVKLGKKISPESSKLWESLSRTEYAVGVTDSGTHTYAVAGGMVYEVHWDKGPDDPKLTEAEPIEKFFNKWGSGVIAVPPESLPKRGPEAHK